jgi:hypothetical protein
MVLGNCPECGNNEWAATDEETAAANAGPLDCAAVGAAAQAALATVATTSGMAPSGYAGPVATLTGGQPPASSCRVVAVVIPADAEYIAYRYEVYEGDKRGDCAADQPCTTPQARWHGQPHVERGQRTVIWGVFENLSAQHERRGRLVVMFTPASGWKPPT